MELPELPVKISYITYGDQNIRDSLITPALKVAKYYKRSVGFFSTGVLEVILDGVVALARNGGSIQIIASPHLTQQDVDAVALGYEMRESVMKSAFLRNFDDAIEALSDQRLKLAAQLIASGVLDIRITDLASEDMEVSKDGDYHDKLGIITDSHGNSIVFVGSPNETINGYKKNYEKVRVFKSWIPAQNEYVQDEISEFDAMWAGTNPFLRIYDFRTALVQHVLKIQEKRNKAQTSSPIKLRDYQEEAISAWVQNNYHGFYVMATGTGKTWTAIFSALRLQEAHKCLTVICAPYKHLVRQWAEDVARVMPSAELVLVSSENFGWEEQLTQAIVKQRLQKDVSIIVMSTIKSFNLDRFSKAIAKSKQKKLLIVDEAHRFTQRPSHLKDDYDYMLGLSATPFSGKNAEKGRELMSFFGGQVYSLPIEHALEQGFLVPYYYHPIFVHATSEDEERFQRKSARIASCFKNGICIDPKKLALYIRGRLRVISMAEEKKEKIHWILDQVQEQDHFIVYCGDGKLFDDRNEEIRHIQFVKRAINARGNKASQFTAAENMHERMDLVNSFNDGEIDALAAIRCLDEGINIPSIRGALILSSNDDYREFVQRRGRILRLYGDKAFANIYDVIVLPSCDVPKMAEIELRRFYEYARLSKNAKELLDQLGRLAVGYGIDMETISTGFEDMEEDEIDD